MLKTSARIVLDSISPDGIRIITLEATFHRLILAELNTPRVFSRNAASSRAIPSSRLMERIQHNPALPVFWGANQAGMQAATELEGAQLDAVQNEWQAACTEALGRVHFLSNTLGLHKQLADRLLEPWMYTTDIITSTEWTNLLYQRCHPAAQPEMRALADEIQRAIFTSEPKRLEYGQWHLPYITQDERIIYASADGQEVLTLVSAARVARVSYLNHDGTSPSVEKDLGLFVRLRDSDPMHLSPLEHVASPCI